MGKLIATYVWLDAAGDLRSKRRVLASDARELKDVPVSDWAFDGSSTGQSEGHDSDLILRPVKEGVYPDPFGREGTLDCLVFAEVLSADGTPHKTNDQHVVRAAEAKYKDDGMLFGIEQEYFLLKNGVPLGWPDMEHPPEQGTQYCGTGADRAFGREVSDRHLELCLKAGLPIWGTNAEVAAGQWEFQTNPCPAMEVCAALHLMRYVLLRVAEEYGVCVSFAPKIHADRNGSGCHTNFSTRLMRESKPHGPECMIDVAILSLQNCHAEHIAVYGEGNEERLSGKYETSSIDRFTAGERNRGASVRVPVAKGYVEDRRPAANMRPERVVVALMDTVCGVYDNEFDPAKYGWVKKQE